LVTDDHDLPSIEADPLFARVVAAGQSMRRIDRAEESISDGQRSIWHQGKEMTELSSWEDDENEIQRQELEFLGLAVVYERGRGLRTGQVQEAKTEAGMQSADLIALDETPSVRTLQLSARLMREAKRDFYTQHLLRVLNDALTHRFNRPQTEVIGLNRWRRSLRRASVKLGALRRRRMQIAFYVGAGVAIGALVTGLVLLIT
jgi:hypothetical protein